VEAEVEKPSREAVSTTVSVIIVNYNVRQFLENSLSSLRRALAGFRAEIFVVDNASSDGSAEMVRAKFPEVLLMQNAENVGFAKANNQALRRSTGDSILLINPDTIVQEDTIRVMLRFFEDHPDAGLAGCKILNPDGTFQLPCRRSFPTPWVAFTKIFGLSALLPNSKLFGRYNLTYRDPEATYPVDAVSGSFMMVRRQAYEKVGGLDETFFMYGEDLDWCYRFRQAGYAVYYVHETTIIHFKGESTRRSEIDGEELFYRAMELFVQKHFSSSGLVKLVVRTGIFFRRAAATIGRSAKPIGLALLDFAGVDAALFVSAALYSGEFLRFPLNAHPVVWFVPALLVLFAAGSLGVYTKFPFSAVRSAGSVIIGYTLLSAVVFFAKEFAYSRLVVLLSGFLSIVLLPGWRIVLRFWWTGGAGHRALFGRRTVIVGTGPSAEEIARRLRARVDGLYDVLGYVAAKSALIGEKIGGIPVLGSLENVGKVLSEQKVAEVIFATDSLSYTDMLSVIARTQGRNVSFRMVAGSLEAIIGKTRIDELNSLPLVDIDYRIHKAGNRITKRVLDLLLSGVLLLLLSLPAWIAGADSTAGRLVRQLRQVFSGKLSLVGRPAEAVHIGAGAPAELGPRGMTGLVQINSREDLTVEEVERYELYYAKNQSLLLDLEILAKSLLFHFRK
jgi:GT2 family glycosyltransferase